jgi:hypothetical protein
MESKSIIEMNREIVMSDYNSAVLRNREMYLMGNVKATDEYIYPNQKMDAAIITDKFYQTRTRVISIVKRTKVGMDGLIIEISKNMATHPDDNFALHRSNILDITAMSNLSWEEDMKNKIPTCFKDNVYHHGKLKQLRSVLNSLKNALIIIDEIDCGDKEDQKLHTILKESGILDIKYMNEKNIRIIFVSATMRNELLDLYKWGDDNHYTHYMTIPPNYIGHKEFLSMGIIKEYYPIKNAASAERWVQEDILQNYGDDYRVHLIRTDEKHKDHVMDACIRNGIIFKNHTSDERITHEELVQIFDNIGKFGKHIVIAIKGFYRRANLIPNEWKKKIGATHERYAIKYDTNVQVQGFPGRMSGFWRADIEGGHKTGPHRTSIDAIREYEAFYENPMGDIQYSTNGSKPLFMNPRNIQNLGHIHMEEGANLNEYKRVPVIIDGIDENDIIFTTKKRSEKTAYVLEKLGNSVEYAKLRAFIKHPGVICVQISQPNTNSSYKKHITDVVKSSLSNTPYSIDLADKHKDKNNWQLYIDNRQKRLCFVIWSIQPELY